MIYFDSSIFRLPIAPWFELWPNQLNSLILTLSPHSKHSILLLIGYLSLPVITFSESVNIDCNYITFSSATIIFLPSATVVAERWCLYTCLSVILFAGDVWANTCLRQTPPGQAPTRQTPLWVDTPRQNPPWEDTPHGRHSPETTTTADGTYPTWMHSCFKLLLFVNHFNL